MLLAEFGVGGDVLFIRAVDSGVGRDRRDNAKLCLACGYDMRGLSRCPECGRERGGAAPVGLAWRVAIFDLATLVVNVLLVGLTFVAVVVFVKGSWFTAELWHMNRGPRSISGVLMIALGGSLVAWGAAWELSSHASYRVQKVVAVWTWALTVFHAVGVVSVWV